MKLHIENNQNKTTENTPTQEVYQLHFHKEESSRATTKTSKLQQEIFYTYSDANNNLEKAFDILFESMLKNGIDTTIDNTN